MEPLTRIAQVRRDHLAAIDGTFERYGDVMAAIGTQLADCLARGNKVLACGNGGSACDAMHFAGELVGRFVNDRKALPAIALTADSGILTAIGNDYGFEEIFARQVRAHGQQGDMLIAISTSGQSQNVLNALEAAKELDMMSVLLTGEKGADVPNVDFCVPVTSSITAHIQETHITILQLIIAIMEDNLL